MPWRPLPRIAFAVAVYPFQPSSPADLPLELGDELYIIEQGGANGAWYRGYLVAPPSLLAGLTSVKGQTLEARVFSGIFPKNCVEVREVLGDAEGQSKGGEDTTGRANSANGVLSNGARSSDLDSKAVDVNGVSDTKKSSQVTVIKQEEGAINRNSRLTPSPSLRLTPISPGPRDPESSKPPAPVPMLKIGDETPTSSSEPLVDEIASCLREWHSKNLHELLLARQYGTLEEMSNIVQDLDVARRQLLHDVLTAKERSTLRQKTVWNLVRGNKMLSNEVVVRDPDHRGRLLTGDDSAVELTKLQSEMSMLEDALPPPSDSAALHHLLFEVNGVSGTNVGSVSLEFSLWLKSGTGDFKQLSETYNLNIPSAENFSTLAQSAQLKTLFNDLSATDIGEGSGTDSKLYLVVKLLNPEPPRVQSGHKPRTSTSRDGNAPLLNNAGKGSLKTRRSVIWGQKQKGYPTPGPSYKDNPRQHSTDSTSSKENHPESSTSGKTDATVTRFVGAGVLDVGALLRNGKEVEQAINIWTPLGDMDEETDYNEGFDEIIRSILYSPTGRYTQPHRAARLHTHLYPFTSGDADELVRSNPTLLQSVTHTPRMFFPTAPTKPRSDIYLTLSRAAISHDALLSHPVNTQVTAPQTSGLRNLQLTMEVRNSEGSRIERAIYPSSNSSGHTAWRTTVTERGRAWNQTIRLNIPADDVPGSHLIMSLANAPEFPFALSWMPLWDQQAFIRDGTHTLLLHAYDGTTSAVENGKAAYLSLPWSALGKNQSTKDEAVTGPVATLAVETNLCSTEYSQDQVILGLINGKEKPTQELLGLLRRIVFVPEIEIAKQLRGVFDALFSIMVEHAGNEEFEDLIFNDLVTVLGIVHDRRFNLGPLVDKYVDQQFNFPFATPCLIRSYSRLLQATSDPQQSRNLRAAFKVGRHLLKFIINAREQQKMKEEVIGLNTHSAFNRDLHAIFESVETLMQNPAPSLVGSKTLVVQHFHTWLPELSKALDKEEIIKIALSFMESCKDVKSMLILYKLVLILNYIRLPLFQEPDERKMLLSHCVAWIAPYWGEANEVTDQYRDQVRLCASIVAEQLKNPEPELFDHMPKAVASYCALEADGVDPSNWLSLLFSKSFPFQLKQSKTEQKFDEGLVELSAIIAAMSKIPNPKPLELDDDQMAVFLMHSLDAHKSVLSSGAYPSSWVSLHIYHHRSVMKSLEYLSSILIDRFLPSPEDADNFDMELWKAYFTTLLRLVSSDALALETFPEQKRRAVWKIAGDVREYGAELLRKSWEAIGWETSSEERERYGLKRLGGYQVQYVPSLVPQIVELCLSAHEGLRHVAVDVLQTMIVSEWQLNEDLMAVEAEMISSLDSLFKEKNVNGSSTQKLFINELLERFEIRSDSQDADLNDALKELVETVDELLDLLIASQNGNITESFNTLKLMEFMKDMQREDIFIRYVHELSQGQAAARNYTEAGLALQFHADLYEWDATKMVPELSNPPLPEQSSFDRKESLYFQIIQFFEDGKAWTHALACYKELVHHYEHTVVDFSKLSRAQASMAKIYDLIVKEDAQVPRYFRVTFKGLGFPPALQNKQYIFEGSPFDRMATFTDRMQKQYPTAQFISTDSVEDIEGQFLQVSAVSVHRDLQHQVFQRSKVPLSVREHLLSSTPSQFSVTTKRHTSKPDVKDQWVVKTVYTTAEPFPNILRRSEIVASEENALTPLQTAVERTWRKTQELAILEKRVLTGEDLNAIGLTDVLQPLLDLDSARSTSVARYRAFLEDDESEKATSINGETAEADEAGEQEEEKVTPFEPLKNALSVALVDHALALRRCINLYSQPAYQSTRADLTRRLGSVFAPEIASFGASPNALPEPGPLSNGSPTPRSSPQPPLQPLPQMSPVSSHQEPEQSTRERSGTQSSTKAAHRLSLNLFRRPSHRRSQSMSGSRSKKSTELTRQGDTKGGGASTGRPSTGKTEPDAEAVSNHSRAPSRSQKRRSFFGGGGGSSDAVDRSNNAEISKNNNNSQAAAASGPLGTPTEDMRTTQQRITERALAARSQERLNTYPDKQGPSAPSPHSQSQSATPTTPTPKHTARPSTSERIDPSGTNGGTGAGGGVRDSVMKRFSMLKGGRKSSKANFRDALGGSVKEE